MNTIEKWDILENIVTKLCSELTNAKVEKNKKIKWKSWTIRQIDTYIEWKIWPFNVKINVESKNYNTKIDIGKVDALIWKIEDVWIDIWVLVWSKWFTQWAINRAISWNIQLIEPLSEEMNSHLLLPVWLIIPKIYSLWFSFSWSSKHWWFRMPYDLSRVRIRVNRDVYNLEQLWFYAWNNNLIPRKSWTYEIPMNVMSIADKDDLEDYYYAEVTINATVVEDYYLRLFPINWLKNITPWKEQNTYKLVIDINSQDMSNWKKYSNFTELQREQRKLSDSIKDIKDYLIYADYKIQI